MSIRSRRFGIRRLGFVSLAVTVIVSGLLPPVFGTSGPPTRIRMVPVHPTTAGSAGPWDRPVIVCAPITFTMAALVWEAAEPPTGDSHDHLALAEIEPVGRPEGAVVVAADPEHGPDAGSAESDQAAGLAGTDPVWTGEARCIRVRIRPPPDLLLRSVRAVFLDPTGEPGSSGTPWAPTPAAALTQQPAMVTRAGWGADEGMRNCGPDYADKLRMAFVHHTATGSDYSGSEADDVIRGIYAYHTEVRGFCDIAYHFLIDRFGRTYEGRFGGITEPVNGGHAQGFNTGSTGVALLGNFMDRAADSRALDALKRLLAWRLDIDHLRPTGHTTMVSGGGSNQRFEEGEKVRLPIIAGHRDTGITACPGDLLYTRLDGLRRAAERIGLPKIWRPRQTPSEIEPGQTVRYRATLSDDLRWILEIRDESGTLVARLTGRDSSIDVTWDGRTPLGLPVSSGTYDVVIRAKSGGLWAREAALTLTVSSPFSQPSPTPTPTGP